MGAKPGITGEIAVKMRIMEAVEGRWSAEKLAQACGVNGKFAYYVLRQFSLDCTRSAVAQMRGIGDGVWPALLKQAEKDRIALDQHHEKPKKTVNQDRELTNAVLRLAAIAGAARGRIPEAETNGSGDDARGE